MLIYQTVFVICLDYLCSYYLLFHIELGCEMYNVLSLVVADIPPVDFFPCLCLLSPSSFVFPFGEEGGGAALELHDGPPQM